MLSQLHAYHWQECPIEKEEGKTPQIPPSPTPQPRIPRTPQPRISEDVIGAKAIRDRLTKEKNVWRF